MKRLDPLRAIVNQSLDGRHHRKYRRWTPRTGNFYLKEYIAIITLREGSNLYLGIDRCDNVENHLFMWKHGLSK